jgi:hypothetical protein
MREKRGLSRLRPSPAMVVALIALVAGAAGSAVALPGRNSVQSNDIKSGAVKKRHIAGGAVNQAKLAPGVRSLLNRPYAAALVAADGSVVEAIGITSSNVTHPDDGQYCFNLAFNPTVVNATAEGVGNRLNFIVDNTGRDFIVTARARPDAASGSGIGLAGQNCAGAEDGSVEIADPQSADSGGGDDTYEYVDTDAAFYVEFR